MKYQCKFCSMLIISTLIILSGCKNRNERLNATKSEDKSEVQIPSLKTDSIISNRKIDKAVYLLENSGSMYGYVNGTSEFKSAVVKLAYLPSFDNITKSFYFVNGTDNPPKTKKSKFSIEYIGSDPNILKNNLTVHSYSNHGHPNYSDLTKIFEIALDSVQNNNIVILISDCIYDVGEEDNPLTALEIETQKTQEAFRRKLSKNNIQTIIIKALSKFNGTYYFASEHNTKSIAHERPYYIIVFGQTELIDKFNVVEDIKDKIEEVVDIARFLKFDKLNIPFQATSQNCLGDFKFDRINLNKLKDVEQDRNGQGFQFSFATDFSSLPFANSYFQLIDNYSCNENYNVTSVEKVEKKIYEVTSFTPTHLITVSTSKSPYCNLSVSLKNVIPSWIINTNTDNESNIENDTIQTFGFKSLIDAISEAYQYKNKEKNIAKFEFELTK